MFFRRTIILLFMTAMLSAEMEIGTEHSSTTDLTLYRTRRGSEKEAVLVIGSSTLLGFGGGWVGGGPIGAGIGAGVGLLYGVGMCLLNNCWKDDTPPRLVCYDIKDHTIPNGQTSVNVLWRYPDASDPESGVTITHKGPAVGDALSAGTYTVIYIATNNAKLTSTCEHTFKVGLHVSFLVAPEPPCHCEVPGSPYRGSVTCSSASGAFPACGDTCTWSCEPGYELVGDPTQQCEQDGEYSGSTVRCEGVECGEPPLLNSMEIHQCSDDYRYKSVCVVTCIQGFGITEGAVNILNCGADRQWTGVLEPCTDKQPPVFETCLGNIIVWAEKKQKYGIATWEVPTATDPTDGEIQGYLTHGSGPGSQFSLEPTGVHTIVYSATDSDGNEAKQCDFLIIVQERACLPYPFSERMNITCYYNLVWGSHCDLECDQGYPLEGNSTVYCELNADKTDVTWDWGNGRPNCTVMECPELNIPENGAWACSSWHHGENCAMLCNEEYDVPRGEGSTGTGIWVCDDTKGVWFPPATEVPDCSVIHLADKSYLPSEVLYYSGDCTDHETQVAIKQNFIDHILASQYSSTCTKHEECKVENVDVTCGEITSGGKKKKSTYTHIIRMDFRFTMKLLYPDGYTKGDADAFTSAMDDKFYAIADLFQQDVRNGTMDLSVAGLDTEIDEDSFKYGLSEMVCELGMSPRWNTFTCASCPKGTMYNSTIDTCEPCPVGMYQDLDGQLSCKQCPEYTSTLQIRSKRIDQCIDMCTFGHYSETGLEDCALCRVGTYQDRRGKKYCIECPKNTTTLAAGSTHLDLCLAQEEIQNLGLCNRTHCNGGFCLVEADASVHCVCHGGYRGESCEIPPDPCENHLCQNGGSCVALEVNYTCLCTLGFTGLYCQHEIVNGGYTSWAPWTDCPVTCGSGSRSRERGCINPPPGPEGLPCKGEARETQACNRQDCPVCPPIDFPYGHVQTCFDIGDDRVCQLTCRDGLILYDALKPNITCGQSTNYRWTYGADDLVGEKGLSNCTRTRMAKKYSLPITFENSSIDCTKGIDKSNIADFVNLHTNCSRMALCDASVTTQCDVGAGRRKRESGLSVIVVTIEGSISQPDYFPGGLYDADIAATAVEEFKIIMLQIYSLIQAIEKALTANTLYVFAEGHGYVPIAYIDCSGTCISCFEGTISRYGLCVSCPPGTYQNGQQCKPCEVGYYQNQQGKTGCTSCPAGLTTPDIGATSVDECSVTANSNHDANFPDNKPPGNTDKNIPSDNTGITSDLIDLTTRSNTYDGHLLGPTASQEDSVNKIQGYQWPIAGGTIGFVILFVGIVIAVILWRSRKQRVPVTPIIAVQSCENIGLRIDITQGGATITKRQTPPPSYGTLEDASGIENKLPVAGTSARIRGNTCDKRSSLTSLPIYHENSCTKVDS